MIFKKFKKGLFGEINPIRGSLILLVDRLCRLPKLLGAICKLREMNQVYIMKLGWDIRSDFDNLWCRVLRSKYYSQRLLNTFQDKNSDSCLGKAIADGWNHIVNGEF